MSEVSNRISINGTGQGPEAIKPEIKPSPQPGKTDPRKAGLSTLPFSSEIKKGVTDWFRQKGLAVTVIDSNQNGQVDPQDIFPENSETSPEQIKEELKHFAEYLKNVSASDKAKLQEFLKEKYGESFVIDDQDTQRGGNNNQKIDEQELVFTDKNINKQEALQNYQISKLSVPAVTPKEGEAGEKKIESTEKSFNGSVVFGFNLDDKNHITEKKEGTAFWAGDFSFPIKDYFNIKLSALLTSNPSLLNKSMTARQIIEGYYPGGFAVNKLFSDFIWKTKGISPIISVGFLKNYAKNWVDGVGFDYFPTTNNDNLERIIQNDRLGLGFGVNKLFNINNFPNFPSVVELNTQVSGGPYFPGGIILQDNNKLKDNIGFWVEGLASARNSWQFKDIAALEYGIAFGIKNKGFKEDAQRKNDVVTDFKQAVAANFSLGKGWELRFGSDFGQMWKKVTNDKMANETSKLSLPAGVTQQVFGHSYRPFLGAITPYWSKVGQFEVNLIGDFLLTNLQTLGQKTVEVKPIPIVDNTSESEMGFAVEVLWNKMLGQDWLSLGMNGGLTKRVFDKYNFDKDSYEKQTNKWGHFTLYLKFRF